jgi:hypothetical protein
MFDEATSFVPLIPSAPTERATKGEFVLKARRKHRWSARGDTTPYIPGEFSLFLLMNRQCSTHIQRRFVGVPKCLDPLALTLAQLDALATRLRIEVRERENEREKFFFLEKKQRKLTEKTLDFAGNHAQARVGPTGARH